MFRRLRPACPPITRHPRRESQHDFPGRRRFLPGYHVSCLNFHKLYKSIHPSVRCQWIPIYHLISISLFIHSRPSLTDRTTDHVSWYTIHKWKAVSRFGNLLNLTAMVKKKRKKSDVYLTNFSRYFSYFLVQHFVSLSNIFSAPFWICCM